MIFSDIRQPASRFSRVGRVNIPLLSLSFGDLEDSNRTVYFPDNWIFKDENPIRIIGYSDGY